jgi:hypothetical protein
LKDIVALICGKQDTHQREIDMNDEKWDSLLSEIEDKFGFKSRNKKPLAPGPGEIETVEFDGPAGPMRLERVSKPVVLDRKTHYSKRIGSATTEEYQYSETDKYHRVRLLRWNNLEGNWMEVDLDKMV